MKTSCNISEIKSKMQTFDLLNNMTQLILLDNYFGESGYLSFLKLSIRNRMVAICKIVDSIYSKDREDQKEIFLQLSDEMTKIVKCVKKKLLSNLPKKGGTWTGQRGNSVWRLDDSFLFKCHGTTKSIKEWRKMYHINE